MQALKDFVDRKLPTISPTRWNFTSRLAITVKEKRKQLLAFFNSILQSPGSWDNYNIVKSLGFVRFLEKHETVFLLHVSTTIFKFTDVLFDILQSKAFNVIYCKKKVDEVHSALVQMRNNNFNDIWNNVVSGKQLEYNFKRFAVEVVH